MPRPSPSRSLPALLLALGAALPAQAGDDARPPAPPAEIGGVTETLHGRVVRDPYRGLEDRAAAAAWIDAHVAKAEAWLAARPDPALDRRLDELTRLGRVGSPQVVGASTWYVENDGDREQGVLRVREGGASRTVVDPNALDPTGKTALDGWEPSEKGRFLVYRTSKDGTEDSVLRVLDVAAGKDTGLEIPDTRWSSVSWLPDETGFYYTRYAKGERYAPKVRFHRLGDDPAKDPLVFGEGRDPTDFPAPVVSEDGTHVAFAVERGWSATDLYLVERASGRSVTIAQGGAAKVWPVRIVAGVVWALTNEGAPRFRLVRIDPAHPEPAAWLDVVPTSGATIEEAVWAAGHWALKVLDEDAVSRVVVADADGSNRRVVALPEAGGVFGVSADPHGTRVAFGFSSSSIPSAVLEFDASAAAPLPKPLVDVEAPKIDGGLAVRRVRFPSYDGTSVPMWIVHRAGAVPGAGPVLLTGYGGFSSSEEPTFSTMGFAWVERGGVYAIANLRGGNEFGEAWHQAGMRERKFQVFFDFEYAMRWLEQEGWATPATLAITGGSNGGLLMGAMMTRCPSLFGACVGAVGLYDMIRFQKWPPAELWVDEYGSADDPAQIGYLLAYSPYHNVVPGVRYPAFLGATAEEDTRVTWRHTAKFVAALERAQAGDAPILFHLETKAGHGQGKNRSDRVKDLSRTLRFLGSQVGLPGSAR